MPFFKKEFITELQSIQIYHTKVPTAVFHEVLYELFLSIQF